MVRYVVEIAVPAVSARAISIGRWRRWRSAGFAIVVGMTMIATVAGMEVVSAWRCCVVAGSMIAVVAVIARAIASAAVRVVVAVVAGTHGTAVVALVGIAAIAGTHGTAVVTLVGIAVVAGTYGTSVVTLVGITAIAGTGGSACGRIVAAVTKSTVSWPGTGIRFRAVVTGRRCFGSIGLLDFAGMGRTQAAA